MSFLTGLALKRLSVTILVIILLLVAGVSTFRSLERELFPEFEFPNISISTVYPSANPDAVMRDVTEPIEEAIEGMDGLKDLQSVSSENLSLVLATFEFGEDLEEAERTIESNLTGLEFPAAVEDPDIFRITNDTIPVLQLSVTGDRDIPALQRILDELIIPRIEGVDGVFDTFIVGEVDEQVVVLYEEKGVLSVPKSALYRTSKQMMVRVMNGAVLEERAVIPGDSDGSWVSVLEGLEEGDRVVVDTAPVASKG
ncbi:MAG: hypothetical protein BZY88_05090 [SAR202 cluster bacterium Io17-Chloro-G9]|nr:MAG: hypothetical protein BZY88_05090 [SAR202 cluster bacterium Io17-Chloro-G9]